MLPLAVGAGLDWTAHLLTTAIVLRAVVPPGRLRPLVTPALLASVAIDADHIPLALDGRITAGQPRPATHHPATPLAALAVGAALPEGRARAWALGAAVGLGAHLGRDLFTGEGVRGARLPVAAEPWLLGGLAVAGALRR
jgi:hypothetical protein